MKELKSKKTGLIQLVTEEEYARLVNSGNILMTKFIVTELKSRPIVPSLKLEPKTNKPKK